MPRRKLRILVAVDFSPESAAAWRAARELAARTGGSITLAHVRPYSDVGAAVAENRGDLIRGNARRLPAALARHYRERFDAIAGRDRGVRRVVLRGKPSLELRREAARGYDLLVIGHRGRGRVASSLLGSTVQEILVRCPVPVVVAAPG